MTQFVDEAGLNVVLNKINNKINNYVNKIVAYEFDNFSNMDGLNLDSNGKYNGLATYEESAPVMFSFRKKGATDYDKHIILNKIIKGPTTEVDGITIIFHDKLSIDTNGAYPNGYVGISTVTEY